MALTLGVQKEEINPFLLKQFQRFERDIILPNPFSHTKITGVPKSKTQQQRPISLTDGKNNILK